MRPKKIPPYRLYYLLSVHIKKDKEPQWALVGLRIKTLMTTNDRKILNSFQAMTNYFLILTLLNSELLLHQN